MPCMATNLAGGLWDHMGLHIAAKADLTLHSFRKSLHDTYYASLL